MFFTIDAGSSVAIYEQIVRQVKYAIADGALMPGQLLPSARQLSVEMAINPNTVVRAFQQLQAEGILETIRGRGLAVCPGAKQSCVSMRKSLVTGRISSALAEAIQGGFSPQEVLNIVEEQLTRLTANTNGSSQSGHGNVSKVEDIKVEAAQPKLGG